MKKILATILALVMVFALCACGSSSVPAAETEAAPAAEIEAAPAAETTSDVLIMGTSADYAPFEFMYPDESGAMVYGGIDVFAAEYIAEATGKTLQIENMAFDYLLVALQKGDYDMVMAAIEATEDRLNAADFSIPYYTDLPAMILVKADKAEALASLEDFSGLTIAAQTGTTKLNMAYDEFPDANIVPLQNVTDIVNQLVNDKIDAAILDGGVATEYASKDENLGIAKASEALPEAEPFCIAVQKGDPKGLLPGLNAAIEQMIEEGKIAEFSEKAAAIGDDAVAVSVDAPEA